MTTQNKYSDRTRINYNRSLINTNIEDIAYNFSHTNYNTIINGGCVVAQRLYPTSTYNIGTSYSIGEVDMFASKYAVTGYTWSAGTIKQGSSTYSRTGHTVKLDNVSITGSGSVARVYVATRIDSHNTYTYKLDRYGSFSCKYTNDLATQKQVQVIVSTADSEDDFSAVTEIHRETFNNLTDITNYGYKELKVENIDFSAGTPEYGIQIEIVVNIDDTVSSKDFEFFDFQLNPDVKAHEFHPENCCLELIKCRRYYVRYQGNTVYFVYGWCMGTGATNAYLHLYLGQPLRKLITDSEMERNTTYSNYNLYNHGGAVTGLALDANNSTQNTMVVQITCAPAITANRMYWLRNNNNTTAYLGFTAELF